MVSLNCASPQQLCAVSRIMMYLCAGSPSRCCSAADVRTRATSMFGTATPFVPPATAVSHRTKSVVDHVWIQSFP